MDVESATPASVDMGDEDCFAGTGRDCLTVVEIVSIGAFSSIGSVILIGAIFMGIYLNGRDTRRGRRFLSWCAKICCCEPAVDDDTLVQIITHPQEGTPEDNRTGISSEENNVSAAAASNNDSHESPPKVFRPDTPSEPATSPNGNIAPAEACEVKNEPVSPVQCQIEPKVEPVTPQGLVEPKVEPLTPQSLPDSPQSYAEAAKANLSPINTTNSSRGDADVTDTSTPNKSAAGKGKRSLLSALFGGGGGSSARKLSNAADSSKLSNNDSSNPPLPTSPLSEHNEKSHVEEKSFPEEEILEKSEIEDNEKGDKKNPLEESVAEQQQQSWTGGSSSSSAEADFSPDESCDTSALTGGAGGDTSAVSGFDTSGAAAGATPSSRKNNSSFFGRLRSRMASPPPTNNDDSNLD